MVERVTILLICDVGPAKGTSGTGVGVRTGKEEVLVG